MGAPASRDTSGGSATVVVSQKVRAYCDHDYQRWQEKVTRAAETFDGFEGTEVYPPGTDSPNEWVVVFRFGRLDQLTSWLDSERRRSLLVEGELFFEGPQAQEVLRGGASVRQDTVTAVVSHDVRRGREKDFLHWQSRVLKAQEKFPGFRGSELFQPVEGVQERWVAMFRFDTRGHLDEWLESDERARLLKEGGNYFTAYDVRKVPSAFSGWFRFGERAGEEVPPNWKQAMSVVLALYPTVTVLNLTVGHAFGDLGLPGYIGLFFSNCLSVAILTWFLMPLVNRALAFWLTPSRSRTMRVQLTGVGVVLLCWAALITIFGLTTH